MNKTDSLIKNKGVVITNPRKFRLSLGQIVSAGPKKLHILADFDRTLTCAYLNGRRSPSLIYTLMHENLLTPDYSQKARRLYDKYHRLEISPRLSFAIKKKAMRRWWTEHFRLLIESGLSKKVIRQAVATKTIKLRPGLKRFLYLLKKNNIPLVIMSSSGIGYESIFYYLHHHGLFSRNVFIISNNFIWNKNGQAQGVKKPIIHSLNKKEVLVRNFPFFKKIENRTNVLLLGDHTHDKEMVTGFDYHNLIKIGFLNENIKSSLKIYKNAFDLIVLNDGPLDSINKILAGIINGKMPESLT
jgi:5'-nucleotidase